MHTIFLNPENVNDKKKSIKVSYFFIDMLPKLTLSKTWVAFKYNAYSDEWIGIMGIINNKLVKIWMLWMI